MPRRKRKPKPKTKPQAPTRDILGDAVSLVITPIKIGKGKKQRAGGHIFDSLPEACRYVYVLKPLEDAGHIQDLRVHPSYAVFGAERAKATVLTPHPHKIPQLGYKPDFDYVFNGFRVVEDVKGARKAKRRAPEYPYHSEHDNTAPHFGRNGYAVRLKINMFMRQYPDITFRYVQDVFYFEWMHLLGGNDGS